MADALLQFLADVSAAIRIGSPCVSMIRVLHAKLGEVIAEDDEHTRRISREIVDDIFGKREEG